VLDKNGPLRYCKMAEAVFFNVFHKSTRCTPYSQYTAHVLPFLANLENLGAMKISKRGLPALVPPLIVYSSHPGDVTPLRRPPTGRCTIPTSRGVCSASYPYICRESSRVPIMDLAQSRGRPSPISRLAG
jgi:hypothetical protein